VISDPMLVSFLLAKFVFEESCTSQFEKLQ